MEGKMGMLIGLLLTMLTCFGGLTLAYFSYKKHHKPEVEGKNDE